MDIAAKLHSLRQAIAKNKLAAYVQPVHDEYLNEYPPACAQRVKWLTGFSGSAGAVAVTCGDAALFIDGRYVLQAKAEVNRSLFEQHNIEDIRLETWLARRLKTGQCVGYDPRLTTRDGLKRMESAFKKKGIVLAPVPNLVDALWKDRPTAPRSPVMKHDVKYNGEPSAAKRKRVAAAVKDAGADAAVIAAPDSVCWLLNIRGADVDGSPLVLAPAIIHGTGKVTLFVDAVRCNVAVKKYLGTDVALSSPAALSKTLAEMGRKRMKVLCDPATVPVWYTQALSRAGAAIIDGRDPCQLPKAMKNAVELKGMRNAHIRDGAAVAKLLCWLDAETKKRRVTELDVCKKLLLLRMAHPMFQCPSFNTIAGSGPNGAIVHYRVSSATSRTLKKGELFLLDSGGQYPDGTTDITRTVAIGKPGKEHQDRFTRVLKGHIAIATAQFPEGTAGSQLDALARQYLWQAGLDYDHGTGHGVGHFLNVHEGPQRISKRGGDAPLKPGMVVSNEPGYYKTGAYGIRIESLVAVKKNGKFLGFETLTCAPIDTRLVAKRLLTPTERQWLNRYHAWVYKCLSGRMGSAEKRWLAARCKAI